MNSKNFEEHIYYILDHFTRGGTPLNAFLGGRLEFQVTTIVAGMLANQSLTSTLEAEEMVEAAISYATLIQEKLGQYEQAGTDKLERLLDK